MVQPSSTSPESVAGQSAAKPNKPDNQAYWPSIGTKDQIPGWLRDNDYIIRGHPMPTYSYRRSLRLWRCWHMETMNIWTHLVGSTAFAGTGAALYHLHLPTSDADTLAFGSFLSAAAICFGLSATFHTLRSHSYPVHHFCGRMDILGICVLALGAASSMTYYAFYCAPAIQRVYWALNLLSALAAAVALFDTAGGGSAMRTLRGSVFVVLGLSAMLPVFHGVRRLGWACACREFGAAWYLVEGVSFLVGVGLFVSRVPERLRPGAFDVLGHSHQLFHAFAVLGAAFHIMGLVAGYRYRQIHQVC